MAELYGAQLVDKDDMVLRANARTPGGFEPESVAAWIEACETAANVVDGCVIDVGAYTGLYTVLASMHGAECYAFEPHTPVFVRLKENVALNAEVMRAPAHLSNSVVADVYCYASPKPPRSGLTSASQFELRHFADANSVQSLTLDGMLPAGEPPVVAIKADVEGMEIAVLRGAKEILARSRPLLILEALSGPKEDELCAFLAPFGYRFERVDTRNLLCEAER